MIPGPLTAPIAEPRVLPRGGVVVRVLAACCFALAFAGGWGWLTAWSPFGLTRWEVFETSSTLELEPGVYVVYEEFDGASGPTTRQPLNVLVRSIAGRNLDVTPLLGEPAGAVSSDPLVEPDDPDDEPAVDPDTYRTPWHEGRPTAWFEIERSGTYTVTAFASEAATSGPEYDELLTSFVAVAPDGRPGPAGTTAGLVLAVGVPLTLGLVLLLVARVRWPRRSGRRAEVA